MFWTLGLILYLRPIIVEVGNSNRLSLVVREHRGAFERSPISNFRTQSPPRFRRTITSPYSYSRGTSSTCSAGIVLASFFALPAASPT